MTDTAQQYVNPLEPKPSTHDSHEDPLQAGAAQARAFGFEQIARAFDHLGGKGKDAEATESTPEHSGQ